MLAACLVLAALPLARAAAQVPCACAGRSPEVPSVAREVRLEDVDMIAAIGDSDTAAFAAGSSSLLEYGTEYWGVSFSTGTDGDWVTSPSLANLVRGCSPGLEGGSEGSGRPGPGGPGRGLNVAVSGDWAGGAAAQAEQLVARVAGVEGGRDKWKLVTVYLGGNDICLYSCGTWWAQGDASPEAYKSNLGAMLTTLAQLPRTIVLLLAPPDFSSYLHTPEPGPWCRLVLAASCPCLVRGDTEANTATIRALVAGYTEALHQLAQERTTDTFAVEVVPAAVSLPPKVEAGSEDIDKDAMAIDCFHFNTLTQGQIGTNIWNNLIEPPGNRTSVYGSDLQIKCPEPGQPISLS